MESFGSKIRKLRIERGLLLREVAAHLEIDPSLLSRVEKGSKQMTREHVLKLASVLKSSEDDLLVSFLSDKIIDEVGDERLAIEAILVAEKKMEYLKLSRERLKDQTEAGQ